LFNFSVGLIKKIDKNHKTSSKYTIMMYGVEKRNQNQEYIQTYINQFLISNNKDQVQVVKINVSSSDCRQHNLEKVAEELEVTLKRLHLYAEQHKSEEHKRLMLQEKIEEVQKKKDEVNKEITELKRENDTEQKPAEEEGVAFVTLQKQSEMRRLARFDSFSRAFHQDSQPHYKAEFLSNLQHFLLPLLQVQAESRPARTHLPDTNAFHGRALQYPLDSYFQQPQYRSLIQHLQEKDNNK
jgi:DNA-binding phage protein